MIWGPCDCHPKQNADRFHSCPLLPPPPLARQPAPGVCLSPRMAMAGRYWRLHIDSHRQRYFVSGCLYSLSQCLSCHTVLHQRLKVVAMSERICCFYSIIVPNVIQLRGRSARKQVSASSRKLSSLSFQDAESWDGLSAVTCRTESIFGTFQSGLIFQIYNYQCWEHYVAWKHGTNDRSMFGAILEIAGNPVLIISQTPCNNFYETAFFMTTDIY